MFISPKVVDWGTEFSVRVIDTIFDIHPPYFIVLYGMKKGQHKKVKIGMKNDQHERARSNLRSASNLFDGIPNKEQR